MSKEAKAKASLIGLGVLGTALCAGLLQGYIEDFDQDLVTAGWWLNVIFAFILCLSSFIIKYKNDKTGDNKIGRFWTFIIFTVLAGLQCVAVLPFWFKASENKNESLIKGYCIGAWVSAGMLWGGISLAFFSVVKN